MYITQNTLPPDLLISLGFDESADIIDGEYDYCDKCGSPSKILYWRVTDEVHGFGHHYCNACVLSEYNKI